MPILEAKNLTYTYSIGSPFEKTAVDHINLQIEQGEFVGIIGHTGSGKSTLMQMMNGLLKPTEGTVLLDGRDIWEKNADRRAVRFQVGLVFQYPEYQLFEETVYKDIAFGPKNMGLDEKEIDRRVRETAEAVGLREELLEKAPYALSGGQKRRVAIAGVMAMEPRVLILDEPTAGVIAGLLVLMTLIRHIRIEDRLDALFDQRLDMAVHKFCRIADALGRDRIHALFEKLMVRSRRDDDREPEFRQDRKPERVMVIE